MSRTITTYLMFNQYSNLDIFHIPLIYLNLLRFEYEKDTKIPHSGQFKLEREDHTLGNLIRMQLMRDPDVVFVGYKHPHPIKHHILIRVQTSSKPKVGEPYEPEDAMRAALNDLAQEFSHLAENLKRELSSFDTGMGMDGISRH